MVLKLLWGEKEFVLARKRITIGRAAGSTIRIDDGMVSGNHAVISNGMLSDQNSTNGTVLNGKALAKNRRAKLKKGDIVMLGTVKLRVVAGDRAFGNKEVDDLNQSKRFGGVDLAGDQDKKEEEEAEAKMSVQELMDQEFNKIIGLDSVKIQLQKFYKKVKLDEIREKNGKTTDNKRLYHMIFTGAPGTGKTTMANLVAKIMVRMKLIATDKVVFVNNALDLLAGYAGQTPAKVDAKVEEAKGGVLFIDEAYSVVKSEKHLQDSFGKEAIETIMKHLDPPSCVFIFAGYEKEMGGFLQVNQGLARRIPFRYNFDCYAPEQLVEILQKMCEGKDETLGEGVVGDLLGLVESIDLKQRETQNAGLMNNWLNFAQLERDDRLDIEAAMENPKLASTLETEDLELALDKLKTTDA